MTKRSGPCAIFLLLGMLLGSLTQSSGQTSLSIPTDGHIYLNAERGNDGASGSRETPIQTLAEAARRVNRANGKGAITILMAEGIYALNETVTFHPANWWFTATDRLTIRAQQLPDDDTWTPAQMPVIVSTMPLTFKPYGNQDPFKGASYGIQVETSHVTIQGLRILGTPVHERPADGVIRRNYPIVREGRSLDDLRITQCLFLGDQQVLPNHVAILASGQGVVVDHCVFYHVKDAVVYWFADKPAEHCEMHHNLIVGNYGAAVWSWSLATDFKFYNNVVTGANVVWVLDKKAETAFTLTNSLVSGYNELVNKGGGPADFGIPADPKQLVSGKDTRINKQGTADLELDQTRRTYLHLKPGAPGTELGAGLFTK